MTTATRASIHGTVTAFIVALRVLAAVADVTAEVLRRIANTIAAGREQRKVTTSSAAEVAQGALEL
jgi:hypothetical protein